MTDWHASLLAVVNTSYDQEYASNGRSRYGSYVQQHASEFRDAWSTTPGPIKDPVEFAVAAWRVATGPIMAPGYVKIRPDVGSITLHRDGYDGSLYAQIVVPLSHEHFERGNNPFPYSWQDWEREPNYESVGYQGLFEPDSPGVSKRVAVLGSVTVRVPGHEWPHLVVPSAYEGPTLVAEAQEAVSVLVQHINDDAGPVVAKLLG